MSEERGAEEAEQPQPSSSEEEGEVSHRKLQWIAREKIVFVKTCSWYLKDIAYVLPGSLLPITLKRLHFRYRLKS
jgi:hypothetical protein